MNDRLDYLEHHGIKGMKWGVRKKEETNGNSRRKKKKSLADRFRALRKKRIKTIVKKKRSINDMSDDELRQRLSRLRMEREYKDLNAYLNPKKKSLIKQLISGIADQSVKKISEKAGDRIANVIFKSKKNSTRTDLNITDVSSLNDDELRAFNQRVSGERIAQEAIDRRRRESGS